MNGARGIVHPPDMQDLKKASRDLVRNFGTQEAVEALTGMDQRRVSDCVVPNTADFLPIHVVQELESRTVGLPGWPNVTRAAARLQGFVLVPIPAARGEGALTDHMIAVTAEAGDVMRALADAQRCGLTPDRKAVALIQARELKQAAAELVALLEAGDSTK